MDLREPIMAHNSGERGGWGSVGNCVVGGEALARDRLVQAIERWLSGRPSYVPRSFSHALETRWGARASLAGPGAMTVYTGVSLVQASRDASDDAELPRFVRDAFPHLG